MNILILLDLAPKYHPLLVGVGRELERAGHRVYHAMDSPQNLVRFAEHAPAGPVRIFSEHLAAMEPGRQSTDFPWTAFFPDFDRFENYGIHHGKKQEWYQRLAAGLESFFDSCMRDWKIDLVLYEGVTNSYAWFASQAATRHGARYVGLQGSRLPGRHELHGTSEDSLRQRVAAHYREIEAAGGGTPDEQAWLADYLSAFTASVPDYMKSNGLNLESPVAKYAKSRHLQVFRRLLGYQLGRRDEASLNYRSGPPLSYSLAHVRRNTLRWLRAQTLRRCFDAPVPGDTYYLYPVHFHPEASTSVNSRWYVDEYPVIKNLAFSLPPGTWLYVKDHMSAFAYPGRDFYRKVAALPNVRLISPETNMKQLMAGAAGLITQTGTAGYEALVLGKPVWVLGEVFYDFHPMCEKIGWTGDLPAKLAEPPSTPEPHAGGAHLVLAYFRATLPGALPLDGETGATASFSQIAREIVESAFV